METAFSSSVKLLMGSFFRCTQFEWVCDHAYLPTLAQSIFFLGAIVGGLLFGWIADRYGRIPALAGCNLIGFAAGVATAFVGNFWQFSLCRFLVGFAFDNCFTMMYILGKDLHPNTHLSFYMLIISIYKPHVMAQIQF